MSNSQNQSLREYAADVIRTKITLGEFEPGEKLSERKISELLGVSTMPVKEAFRQLETEGLIVSAPRSGSFVAKDSVDHIMDLVYLHSVIDGVAALLAARHATEEQISEMDSVLKKARSLIDSKDSINEICECNQEFHSLMRKASNNGYVENIGNLINQIDSSVRKAGSHVYDYIELEMLQFEHENILRMVAERKPEHAERFMVSHIRNGSGKIVMH